MSCFAAWGRLELACSGGHGPLDLHEPDSSSLLAKWCGIKASEVLSHVLKRKTHVVPLASHVLCMICRVKGAKL